jgi:hypothetical protein
LFELLQPILQHRMLMMFQLCQVMVMISFSSSITLLASDQLHPGEGKSNLATYLIKNNLLYYFVFTVIYIQIRSVRSYNYTASLSNFSTRWWILWILWTNNSIDQQFYFFNILLLFYDTMTLLLKICVRN